MHLERPYKKDDKVPITGPSSYKEHGFRMLMIWASGLNPDVPMAKELYEALSAVDKKTIAGNFLFIVTVDYYLNKSSAIITTVMQSNHLQEEEIIGTEINIANITIINANLYH